MTWLGLIRCNPTTLLRLRILPPALASLSLPRLLPPLLQAPLLAPALVMLDVNQREHWPLNQCTSTS
jgi:hypothetical protein